ncbi:hypothetical protein Acor_24370 [Acrocarpospora corrugata]|uniref:Uncharacterized protein n=1 Tax=Acrocarpospora corrugata TaxID=35763 RepID=A0A5M3VZ62_9ACTN|nr:hypothetical protein Acor_24370 [Acrocarpospora corrugata]
MHRVKRVDPPAGEDAAGPQGPRSVHGLVVPGGGSRIRSRARASAGWRAGSSRCGWRTSAPTGRRSPCTTRRAEAASIYGTWWDNVRSATGRPRGTTGVPYREYKPNLAFSPDGTAIAIRYRDQENTRFEVWVPDSSPSAPKRTELPLVVGFGYFDCVERVFKRG